MSDTPFSTSDKVRLRAAIISLLVSLVVLGIKTLAYFQTYSTAILSDALESIVNVVAAIVALFVVFYVSQPADREHPYGHGKLEYFSSAFEGGMIFFAAIMVIHETLKSFWAGIPLKNIEQGIAFIVLANLLNLILGFYLKRVGRKENSEALKASGAHVLSDTWTTAGVIVGLFIVKWTGWLWADPLIAGAVAVHLAYEGYKIVVRSINGLIDGIDHDDLKHLANSINKNRTEGVIDIHRVRAIRSGKFHHIDAHIVVPMFWDVKKVHDITHEFEQKVVNSYRYDGEFAFHVDPCNQRYCQICRVQNCHLRLKEFEKEKSFSVEHLIEGAHYSD